VSSRHTTLLRLIHDIQTNQVATIDLWPALSPVV